MHDVFLDNKVSGGAIETLIYHTERVDGVADRTFELRKVVNKSANITHSSVGICNDIKC